MCFSLLSSITYTDNQETLATELHFSQYFIKHCPQLNLLSLVNETELTNGFILTASLAASDAVQVTLNPSTTEIDVMKVMTSTLPEPKHTNIALSPTPLLMVTTAHFEPTTPLPLSTTHQTMDTAVTQSTKASLYTLIAVVIGAVSVCFVTTIIAVMVIAGYCCQRAKSQRIVTNSLESPVIQMVNHAYSGTPHVNTGIYEFIKPKMDPLPDPPDEQYEDMNSIAYPADSAQTKTYINMIQ